MFRKNEYIITFQPELKNINKNECFRLYLYNYFFLNKERGFKINYIFI